MCTWKERFIVETTQQTIYICVRTHRANMNYDEIFDLAATCFCFVKRFLTQAGSSLKTKNPQPKSTPVFGVIPWNFARLLWARTITCRNVGGGVFFARFYVSEDCCFLHIKPFFLPSKQHDQQYPQCPSWFILERRILLSQTETEKKQSRYWLQRIKVRKSSASDY